MQSVSKSASAPKKWYAIRVTYRRELKVKEDLDSKGIENFVPMQYRLTMVHERRVKKLVPSINNLVFIHISTPDMVDYKKTTAMPIRYIMDHETHKPVIVPERQMENFIAVAGTYDEQLVYLDADPKQFTHGEHVRILGGPFEGAEGIFVRIKGDRRVVVMIEGVVAVATAYIHPSLVEKIND